jgi:hypothetical protein
MDVNNFCCRTIAKLRPTQHSVGHRSLTMKLTLAPETLSLRSRNLDHGSFCCAGETVPNTTKDFSGAQAPKGGRLAGYFRAATSHQPTRGSAPASGREVRLLA